MTTTPTASPELPDLDRLEALARAATPGRWMRFWDERTVYDRLEDGCRGNAIVRADIGYSVQDTKNLDFIAAANPAAVLALIALARRAQPEGEAPQAVMVNGRITGAHACFSEAMPPGSLTSIGHAHVYKALQAAIAHYVAHQPAAQHAESGARLDVREGFERWMSNRGEAVNYAGDGMYEYRSTNRQADAFRAGVEYALAAQSQGAQAADWRAALQPFANIADLYAPQEDDTHEVWIDGVSEKEMRITLGQCRAARAALAAKAEAPSATQALIALGKYASGYRPGQDGWTKEDDQALAAAMGEKAEAPAVVFISDGQEPDWKNYAEAERAQQAAAPGSLPYGYLVEAVDGHAMFFKHDPTGFRASKWQSVGTKVIDLFTGSTPSAPGTPEAPADAGIPASGQTAAARDVLAERQRQTEVEGWTRAHDDMHGDGQMAVAAGYYSLASGSPYERSLGRGHMPIYWPWAPSWWKPRTKRENLVRAGALVLAEIERLDRAAQLDGGQGEGADHG